LRSLVQVVTRSPFRPGGEILLGIQTIVCSDVLKTWGSQVAIQAVLQQFCKLIATLMFLGMSAMPWMSV
jgi:hypothetical protein